MPVSAICAKDVALWPYTPGLLVKWVAFLGTLHWPADGVDLGVGDISYVELLILDELWAGERLTLEKAHPRYLRPGRPNSVSAVPFGPGIDFWRSCRFIGALMRSLCLLPGELGRFVPCSIGANHRRLCHIGWEKCGHGLTSRPWESASEPFLNEFLDLSNSSPGSARALLAGTLPLRYCAARFACRSPTWRLHASGHVTGLVTSVVGVEGEFVDCEVSWVSGSGPGRKRIRLNRKTPAHLVVLWFNLVHVSGRVCVIWGSPVFLSLITRGGVVIRVIVGAILFTSGLRLVISQWLRAGPRLQACMIFELA